jgi:hypothetical protein
VGVRGVKPRSRGRYTVPASPALPTPRAKCVYGDRPRVSLHTQTHTETGASTCTRAQIYGQAHTVATVHESSSKERKSRRPVRGVSVCFTVVVVVVVVVLVVFVVVVVVFVTARSPVHIPKSARLHLSLSLSLTRTPLLSLTLSRTRTRSQLALSSSPLS